MKNKEQIIILILSICFFLVLAACGEANTIETGIGSFECSQQFLESLKNLSEENTMPSEGNIFLLLYLKPAEGTELSLDSAQQYFLNGTKAVVAEETYDIYCVAFERISKSSERLALVFEVADKDYIKTGEQPTVQLILPSVPE